MHTELLHKLITEPVKPTGNRFVEDGPMTIFDASTKILNTSANIQEEYIKEIKFFVKVICNPNRHAERRVAINNLTKALANILYSEIRTEVFKAMEQLYQIPDIRREHVIRKLEKIIEMTEV